MIESIPHNMIQASPLNPRKSFSPEGIAELAASIKAEGLLQNLVVRKVGDEVPTFEIAAGERRWRALQQLIEAGDLPEDHPVPCRVADLTDLELLQLATTENMNRADMSPLEEARAFQQMLALGSDVDTIAAETGLHVATVRKRLALVERLIPEVHAALEAGQVNLGQAQALTATSDAYQAALIRDLGNDRRLASSPENIRSEFSRQAAPVSRARFPLHRYTGAIVTPGIFDPDGEDRFADTAQFQRLQTEYAEELLAEAKRTWAWAELVSVRDWRYQQVSEEERDPSKHGVVIELSRFGFTLNILEGMVKPAEPVQTTAGSAVADDAQALTQKHQAEIHLQRSMAVQAAVMADRNDHILKCFLVAQLIPGMRFYSHVGVSHKADTGPRSTAVTEALQAVEATGEVPTVMQVLNGSWDADTGKAYQELLDCNPDVLDWLLRALVARTLTYATGPAPAAFHADIETARFLPTFADLGPDWLALYKPARLQQVSETVLGYSGEGKTKKELVALIAAAQSQDVPAELELEPILEASKASGD